MVVKTSLFIILAFGCFASHAVAWNDLGHMMAGAIAYDRLAPEVRQKVITLLERPDYARQLAAAARESCSRYDWAFVRQSWIAAYDTVARGNCAAAPAAPQETT